MYDGIVILSAKYANWNVHTAMIRQAPRLMWRARERGARAVVFAWPSRSPTCVPIQPLLSSPNFDNVTNIPSFVVDADSLSSISDDCELYIQLPPEGVVGAAELLASRIGDSLQDARARIVRLPCATARPLPSPDVFAVDSSPPTRKRSCPSKKSNHRKRRLHPPAKDSPRR